MTSPIKQPEIDTYYNCYNMSLPAFMKAALKGNQMYLIQCDFCKVIGKNGRPIECSITEKGYTKDSYDVCENCYDRFREWVKLEIFVGEMKG